jgi:hypothetical protein
VEALHQQALESADVYFVYVAEAHAVDEWQMSSNEEEGIRVTQQTRLDERIPAARDAAARLGLTMPVLVDGMENAASIAFAAWPERIVVVDRDGRIAYPGAPGPDGFDPAEAGRRLAALS